MNYCHIHPVEPYAMNSRTLLGEYNAIHETTKLVRASIKRGVAPQTLVPPTFRYARGHLPFFYDKLQYLNTLYAKVLSAMDTRAMKSALHCELRYINDDLPEALWGDWTPSEVDIALANNYLREQNLAAGLSFYST